MKNHKPFSVRRLHYFFCNRRIRKWFRRLSKAQTNAFIDLSDLGRRNSGLVDDSTSWKLFRKPKETSQNFRNETNIKRGKQKPPERSWDRRLKPTSRQPFSRLESSRVVNINVVKRKGILSYRSCFLISMSFSGINPSLPSSPARCQFISSPMIST